MADDTGIRVSLVVTQSAVRQRENNIRVNNDEMARHWWSPRFTGCDTVGCSAKGKQHPCQQWWNGEALVKSAFLWLWHSRLFGKGKTTSVPTMIKWRGIVEVGLAGAFGANGTDISIVFTTIHKSISTLYSSCKQNGKYYSRQFRWTGYDTSSSLVKIVFLLPLRSTFMLGRCSTIYASM